MFQFQNIWLPDGEKHFPEWMARNGELVDGRGTYQIRKWRACLPWIKQWREAVDVGAHVGLWSMQMKKQFETVHAFEPVEAFQACLERNAGPVDHDQDVRGMSDTRPVVLYPYALGAAPGSVSMTIPPLGEGLDTGGTHVGGVGDIAMFTLDSFDLEQVDFIKIDCEGYEHHVLEGARETLLRCKPCVIVEQKPHKLGPNFGITGTPAVDLLRGMGAVLRREMGGDYIMSFD